MPLDEEPEDRESKEEAIDFRAKVDSTEEGFRTPIPVRRRGSKQHNKNDGEGKKQYLQPMGYAGEPLPRNVVYLEC